MDTHRFDVRQLSKRIQSFHEAHRPFHIHHSTSPSHSLRTPTHHQTIVHTCPLTHILGVNTTNNFAMVEPNVTMHQLCSETLKQGLLPPVVAPLPNMTVGGCFAGTAAGSASFKYGYFDRAVNWVEVVLPDGKITRASRARNAALLGGMVGSLGTLGVATLFQVKLVPATRFVELAYLPVKSKEEMMEGIGEATREPENDFVEGLVFGPNAKMYGAVVVGRLAAYRTERAVRFNGAWDDWFWQQVLEAGETTVCVPIMDYLFRHDRGSFNLGRLCFGKIPFNRRTRWLADYALRSGNLAKVSQGLHRGEHLFLQDVDVPVESSLELLEWLEVNLKAYPLFLSPVRQWEDANLIMRPNPTQTLQTIHTTIRGYTPSTLHNRTAFRKLNRDLDRLVRSIGGRKWLHSRNFYSEEEFWNNYPRKEEYALLRSKCGAEYLHTVFEKTKTDEKRMKNAVRVEGFWARVFYWGSVVGSRGEEEVRDNGKGKGKGKEKEKAGEN